MQDRERAYLLSGESLGVLDKGFVRVVDTMGDDAAIVQAARVSYGDGTKTQREDAELINYLMRNKHTSPFEMCEIKLHCKMPIFIARQCIRHRTANVNEYSCRHSKVKDEMYFPDAERIGAQASGNKQATDGLLESRHVDAWLKTTESTQNVASQAIAYGEKVGVAREINRINMTVAHYTEWYWKIDLHNLLHFLRLRLHAHAQPEIREYAIVLAQIVEAWVPDTWYAFEQYILYNMDLSFKEQQILASLFKMNEAEVNEAFAHVVKPDRFSKGEWSAFQGKMIELAKINQQVDKVDDKNSSI